MFNVVLTNKRFCQLGQIAIRYSNETIKMWFYCHNRFILNKGVIQLNNLNIDNYCLLPFFDKGIKIGYNFNKLKNLIKVIIVTHWGSMKKYRVVFSQKRFIWVHHTGFHQHDKNQANVYRLHILNIGDPQLSHFCDIVVDFRNLSKIHVNVLKIKTNHSLCQTFHQNDIQVGSNFFVYEGIRFFVDNFIQDYQNHQELVLIICQQKSLVFDKTIKKLFEIDYTFHKKGVIFQKESSIFLTIEDSSNFIVFVRVGNKWIKSKNVPKINSREQTFFKYCHHSNKIICL